MKNGRKLGTLQKLIVNTQQSFIMNRKTHKYALQYRLGHSKIAKKRREIF